MWSQGLFKCLLLLQLLLLLAKTCSSALAPKRWCKTSTGRSWVLVLRNALDITVEEGPLAL